MAAGNTLPEEKAKMTQKLFFLAVQPERTTGRTLKCKSILITDVIMSIVTIYKYNITKKPPKPHKRMIEDFQT